MFASRAHTERSQLHVCFISLHDCVVVNSTSGRDMHDGRAEVVFFYSVYHFLTGDWSQNTSEYS